MNDEIRVHVVKFPDRKNLVLRFRDPVTGKAITKSARTHRKSEAERAAGQWEAELRSGQYKPPTRTTWEEFRERVEVDYASTMADGSGGKLLIVLSSFERATEPKLMAGVTTETITRWQRHLRKDRGVSESTVKSYTATVKAAFRWAARVGLILEAPVFPMPRRAKRSDRETPMKGRPVTDCEFQQLLDIVPVVTGEEDAPQWQRLLRGLATSGLRISEIVSLSWDDEDAMRVEMSGRHVMLAVPSESEKANRDRLLPIAPEFVKLILETPEDRRTGRVFVLPASANTNNPLTPGAVGRKVVKLGKAANIVVSRKGGRVKHASAHDLRRTFGDKWAQKLMPADLQRLMRHASIETTLRYYVGRTAESLMDTLTEASEREL